MNPSKGINGGVGDALVSRRCKFILSHSSC